MPCDACKAFCAGLRSGGRGFLLFLCFIRLFCGAVGARGCGGLRCVASGRPARSGTSSLSAHVLRVASMDDDDPFDLPWPPGIRQQHNTKPPAPCAHRISPCVSSVLPHEASCCSTSLCGGAEDEHEDRLADGNSFAADVEARASEFEGLSARATTSKATPRAVGPSCGALGVSSRKFIPVATREEIIETMHERETQHGRRRPISKLARNAPYHD